MGHSYLTCPRCGKNDSLDQFVLLLSYKSKHWFTVKWDQDGDLSEGNCTDHSEERVHHLVHERCEQMFLVEVAPTPSGKNRKVRVL